MEARKGKTSEIARDEDFFQTVVNLLVGPPHLNHRPDAARSHALGASWDAVSEKVYLGYQETLAGSPPQLGRKVHRRKVHEFALAKVHELAHNGKYLISNIT